MELITRVNGYNDYIWVASPNSGAWGITPYQIVSDKANLVYVNEEIISEAIKSSEDITAVQPQPTESTIPETSPHETIEPMVIQPTETTPNNDPKLDNSETAKKVQKKKRKLSLPEVPRLTELSPIPDPSIEISPSQQSKPKRRRIEVHSTKESVNFLDKPAIPLNPWIGLNGEINHSFLTSLQRKVAKVVVKSPGIYETAIYSQFNVFRPAVIKQLLQNLELGQIIYSKVVMSQKLSLFSDPDSTILCSLSNGTDGKLCEFESYDSVLGTQMGIVKKAYFPHVNYLFNLENTLTEDGKDFIDQYSVI